MDSVIASCTKPLILVQDTHEQRYPLRQGKRYPVPTKLSKSSYDIIAQGMQLVATRAGFNFIERPIYEIYDDERFTPKLRKSFWKPILGKKYPIYVISPMYGVLWPGDYGGLYAAHMEDCFLIWKNKQLWRVILDLFDSLECDAVMSYLPRVYDNVVRAEGIPWFMFKPEQFMEHQSIIFDIVSGYEPQGSNIEK
jgi:hypothetical protein